MELLGPGGDSFALTLLRYQFLSSSDEFDANWLVVRTSASIGGREWSSEDPALLTWEIERLASWLEDIANDREVDRLEDFVEPNISFKLIERTADRVRLQIMLELESRPPWQEWRSPGKKPDGPVVECSKPYLMRWTEDLKRQLLQFPRRGATT